MAPDLNSLSSSMATNTSRTTSPIPTQTMSSSTLTNEHFPVAVSPGEASPSQSSRSRSASISLQAAATLNAGLQRRDSIPRSSNNQSVPRLHQHTSPSPGRRRSQVLMGLQMADPNIPSPGEMIPETHPGSGLSAAASPRPFSASPQLVAASSSGGGEPRHIRAPSLGEIHQELENEQEFQVNRLLTEIRRLQQQVQRQQSSGALSDDTGASDRSPPAAIPTSVPGQTSHQATPGSGSGSVPRSPGGVLPPQLHNHHPRSSFDIARVDLQQQLRSRTPSRNASPRLRSTSISAESGDQWALGGRDESAFYQAETQMLIRENQMLRHRIRELERQISEAGSGGSNTSIITHEPPHASHLHRSTSASEEGASSRLAATAAQPETVAASVKKED